MTKIDPRNANFEHYMPPVYECPECNFKTDDEDFMAEHIQIQSPFVIYPNYNKIFFKS